MIMRPLIAIQVFHSTIRRIFLCCLNSENPGLRCLAPSGVSAILIGLIFLYLAYLTVAANRDRTRNRAVSSILVCDGLMAYLLFWITTASHQTFVSPSREGANPAIAIYYRGLLIAQSYFISTFSNGFANRFTKYRLGPIFVIGGIFIPSRCCVWTLLIRTILVRSAFLY